MNTDVRSKQNPETVNPVAVTGVKTTRIYCRPDCRPGRSPLPENCIPFRDAQAARDAGYRACKKCGPDPGPTETLRHGRTNTAIGGAFGAVTARGLCALYLCKDGDPTPLERLREDFPGAEFVQDHAAVVPILEKAVAHVLADESIAGIDLDLRGTEFQRRVWDALVAIPRGKTKTYGELTRSLGLAPGAARAVGSACGANPVSLIVPCHRVLRTDGGLGGYYWGLERKQALLDAEKPIDLPGKRLPSKKLSPQVVSC